MQAEEATEPLPELEPFHLPSHEAEPEADQSMDQPEGGPEQLTVPQEPKSEAAEDSELAALLRPAPYPGAGQQVQPGFWWAGSEQSKQRSVKDQPAGMVCRGHKINTQASSNAALHWPSRAPSAAMALLALSKLRC